MFGIRNILKLSSRLVSALKLTPFTRSSLFVDIFIISKTEFIAKTDQSRQECFDNSFGASSKLISDRERAGWCRGNEGMSLQRLWTHDPRVEQLWGSNPLQQKHTHHSNIIRWCSMHPAASLISFIFHYLAALINFHPTIRLHLGTNLCLQQLNAPRHPPAGLLLLFQTFYQRLNRVRNVPPNSFRPELRLKPRVQYGWMVTQQTVLIIEISVFFPSQRCNN